MVQRRMVHSAGQEMEMIVTCNIYKKWNNYGSKSGLGSVPCLQQAEEDEAESRLAQYPQP